MRAFSPSARPVASVMRETTAALVPGAALMIAWLGPGVVCNIVLALAFCWLFEAAALRCRGLPLYGAGPQGPAGGLGDGSAMVTGVLLALALPPYLPWWVTATAAFFAVVVAKQLYGGLGNNLFNPAMVGYCAALVAFPAHMTAWPADGALGWQFALAYAAGAIPFDAPAGMIPLDAPPGAMSLDAPPGAMPLDAPPGAMPLDAPASTTAADALTGATPVAAWREDGRLAPHALWPTVGFAVGGLYLLWRRIIRWHIPAAMLATLGVAGAAAHFASAALCPSPLFHLLGYSSALGAFFVATDPVSSPSSATGALIFGAGVGLLLFAIRSWGAYLDGLAFAVLLMNTATPLLDRTAQRTWTAKR